MSDTKSGTVKLINKSKEDVSLCQLMYICCTRCTLVKTSKKDNDEIDAKRIQDTKSDPENVSLAVIQCIACMPFL